jgi:hypothetical protein
MMNEIAAIYVIIDYLLKAMGHSEDSRRQFSDANLISTVIVPAGFFHSNYQSAQNYLKDHHLMPNMLSKSRFYRLKAIADLVDLLHEWKRMCQLWIGLLQTQAVTWQNYKANA